MMNFRVQFVQRKDSPLTDKWFDTEADTHKEAMLKVLESEIHSLKTWPDVFAVVHGEKDHKWPNGMPAVVHTFHLKIGEENVKQ